MTSGASVAIDTTAGNFAYPGSFTFAGALTKLGTSTLTLTGTNSYAKGVFVNAGTLALGDGTNGAINNSAITINAAGVFSAVTPNAVQGSSGFTLNGGTLQNISGALLTLSNSTTPVSASSTINGSVGSNLSFAGTLTNTNAGNPTLTVNTVTATFNNVNLSNTTTARTPVFAGSGNIVVSGTVANGGGSTGSGLTFNGPGTMTLNGAATYTGTTSIGGGTLTMAGGPALPSGGVIALGAGMLQLLNDGAGSNGTINLGNSITANTISGTLGVGNNGSGNTGNTIALGVLGCPNTNQNVHTTFLGANGYNLTFTNLLLPGNSGDDTYLIPISTSVTILGNVTNQMTGYGTGNYDSIYLNGTTTGNAINGTISDAVGGSYAANKGYTRVLLNNTNTWTFAGSNTYTGPTLVSAGMLTITGSLGNTPVTVSGGTLNLQSAGGISQNTLTLSGGSLIEGLANAVSGTASLTVTSGLNIVSQPNSYSGTTTLTGGVLQANDGVGLPSSSFLSLNGGVLQSNGVLSFTRSLSTAGASNFQFTANGGGFSANGGSLAVNIGGISAQQVWGATVGAQIVGTLQFGSSSANAATQFQNPIDLDNTATAATRTVNVTAGTGVDYAELLGNLSNSNAAGSLTKTGSGLLLLSGSNSYTGTTTVNGGILRANNLTALGASTAGLVVTSGTLDLNNYNFTVGNLSSVAGGIITDMSSGGGTTTLTSNRTAAETLAGIVTDGPNGQKLALYLTGPNNTTNDLTVSGTNTYSGGTTIPAGRLLLNSAYPVLGSGPVVIGTNATSYGEILVNNAAVNYSNAFTIAGVGVTETNGPYGAIRLETGTISGPITLAANSRISAAGGGAAGGTITGTISGPYNLEVYSNAAANVLNLNAPNTYSGTTTITTNVLATNSLDIGGNPCGLGTSSSAASNLILNGGTLRYTGSGATTDRLFTLGDGGSANGTLDASGSGAVNFGNPGPLAYGATTARTLTLTGTNAGLNTLAALIADNPSGGATGLTKTGPGQWVLANSANTYTGTTTLTAGTLTVGTLANGLSPSSIGAASNASTAISFSGGALDYTGASVTIDRAAGFTGSGGGIVVANAGTNLEIGGAITAGAYGTITKSGPGMLTLSGSVDNAYLDLVVSSGTVVMNKITSNGSKSASNLNGVSPGALVIFSGNQGNQIANGLTGLYGTADMNGRTETVTVFQGGATGLVTNNAGPGTLSMLTINGAASSFGGSIQDGASGGRIGIAVAGNTMLVSGTNSFTGGTSLTGGVTTYASPASVSAVGRNVLVGAGGVVAFNFSGVQQQLVSDINGASTGTVALTVTNSAENVDFSAATGGNQPGVFLGASGTVNYMGTFTPNISTAYRLGGGGGTLTFNQNITGATTGLTIGGAAGGTVVLAGNNTFGGGLTLAGTNTTQFASLSNLGTGPINVTAAATMQWGGTGNTTDISGLGMTMGATLTLDTQTNNVTLANGIGSNGTGGLTKLSAGVLTLNGADTFTGVTTITGGSLVLGNANALQNSSVTASSGLVFSSTAGGSFLLGGLTGATNMALQDNGSTPSPITLQIGYNNSAQTYSGVLSSSGGLTKLGNGTETLSGTNTYTGATSVINGPAASLNTPSILKLDFSQAASPATNILNSVSALVLGGTTTSSAQTVLGGGELLLTGKSNAVNSQAVNGTTIGVGGSLIVLTPSGTGSLALNLGAITRGVGGTVDITQPTGTISSTNGILTTTGTASTIITDANGTAFATVGGNDWAAKDPTNTFILGAATAGASGASLYTSASSAANFTAVGAAGNADITGSFTATAGTVGTLRFNTGTLTLTQTGVTTVASGGILFGSGESGNATISGGTLRAGTGMELVFLGNNTHTPQINAVLADSVSGPSSVTYKSTLQGNGNGWFQISSTTANTYSGGTYIDSGRVNVSVANAAPFGTGPVYIDGNTNGEALLTGGTVSNNFYIVGNGWQENNGPFGALRIDNTTVSGNVTLLGNAAIGCQNANGTVIGNISGNYGLTKLGGFTLTLSGTNTAFTGATTISAGAIVYSSTAALGNASSITPIGAGIVGFNYTGIQASINRISSASTGVLGITTTTAAENVSFANLPFAFLGATGSNVTYTGTFTPNGSIVRLGGGGATLTLAGNNAFLNNGNAYSLIVANNSVTLTGTNNYSGGTTLQSTLDFINGGLGSGPIYGAGGILQWATGNTQDVTSGRTVALNSGNTTFDTQTNSVTLNNPVTGTGGTFQKNGAGILTLDAANTFGSALASPVTTLNGGTLTLGVAAAIPVYSTINFANTAGVLLQLNTSESVGGVEGSGTTGGTLALNGNTLTTGYNGTNPNGLDAIITGSGSITKVGTGVEYLRRNNSTVTGLTLTVNNGSLDDDMSQTFSNATGKFAPSTLVVLGGGTFVALGYNSASTQSQTFTTPVQLNAGASALQAQPQNASNVVTLTLSGGVTRNVGATVDYIPGTSGTSSIITSQNNANYSGVGGIQSILGGYAVYGANGGTTWAVAANSGSSIVTGLATYGTFATSGTDVDVAAGATPPVHSRPTPCGSTAALARPVSMPRAV